MEDPWAELKKMQTAAYALVGLLQSNSPRWVDTTPADVRDFSFKLGIPIVAVNSEHTAGGSSVSLQAVGPQDGRRNIVQPPGKNALNKKKRDRDGKVKLTGYPGVGSGGNFNQFSCRFWSEPQAKTPSEFTGADASGNTNTTVVEIGRHYADDVVKYVQVETVEPMDRVPSTPWRLKYVYADITLADVTKKTGTGGGGAAAMRAKMVEAAQPEGPGRFGYFFWLYCVYVALQGSGLRTAFQRGLAAAAAKRRAVTAVVIFCLLDFREGPHFGGIAV
eukprot:gene4376-4629_t